MYLNCAFSGHRNLNDYKFDYLNLDKVIENLMREGVKNFYCGMAVGFDLACAESVLQFKDKYGAKLIACVPCPTQAKKFTQNSKDRYYSVLDKCDEIITVSDSYRLGCMHERDRLLVDRCDVLVCFLKKKSGGTYYTVNYAKSQNKEIIYL